MRPVIVKSATLVRIGKTTTSMVKPASGTKLARESEWSGAEYSCDVERCDIPRTTVSGALFGVPLRRRPHAFDTASACENIAQSVTSEALAQYLAAELTHRVVNIRISVVRLNAVADLFTNARSRVRPSSLSTP